MWKPNTENMVWTRNEISTDDPKGYDSRVPIEMWYRREWTDQVMRVIRSLNIIL